MPTWPASLPAPLLSGYSEALPQLSLRTEMEVGPAKVRRRAAVGVRPVRFNLLLTTAQRGDLEDFYETDTAGGSLSFDWTHPDSGATVTARFGESPPSWQAEGAKHRVAIELEILP